MPSRSENWWGSGNFRREYAVGLSPGIYFLSKVLVLGSAAFVQGLMVTFIATVGLPGPDGRLGVLRLAIAVALLAFTMAIVGLALSALVRSNEQTMPTLVGMIMIQLVLSRLLVRDRGPAGARAGGLALALALGDAVRDRLNHGHHPGPVSRGVGLDPRKTGGSATISSASPCWV